MINLNGNDYKLIALDTNAIREIILNNYCTGYTFFKKYYSDSNGYFAICFSIYNIIELRNKIDIFPKFIEFFCKFPTFVFFPHKSILEYEHRYYLNRTTKISKNEIMISFTPLGKNDSYDFRYFIENVFNSLKTEIHDFVDCLSDVALSWEDQRKNNTIESSDEFYRREESKAVRKFLKFYNIKLFNDYDYKKFPSARIIEYSQFCRVHKTTKNIKSNDVMDVVISAIAPYVDVIITENFQASVYITARKSIHEIENLEVHKIKEYMLCSKEENKICFDKNHSKCYL